MEGRKLPRMVSPALLIGAALVTWCAWAAGMEAPHANCNGKMTREQLLAAEQAIIEDPHPRPIVEGALRILMSDRRAKEVLERSPCRGGACAEDNLCDNCMARRRYVALRLHRLDHGRPVHPSEVAEDEPSGETLPIITLGELLDTYPVMRPPVIDGLLRVGETMNIISATKVGKSWLVYDLALAIATGKLWLETFAVMQGKVLVIDNELHRETIAARFRRMAEARNIPVDLIQEMVHVLPLRGRLKDLRRLADGLHRVERGRYRLIIVDAFYRTLPMDADENSNGTMANLYNEIDSFSDHLGAAIGLIHHSSKGNQSEKNVTDVGSGAGAQARATDTHLILRQHEEDDVFVLDVAVRSFPPVAPRCLRWSFPVWTPAPDLDPTALRTGRPRKPKPDEPPKPLEPPWDAKWFAAAFGRPEPRPRSVILDDAGCLIRSMRGRERLLKAAIDRGLLFSWPVKGANSTVMVSTAPRPAD
jgi:hypothetical protein